MRLSWLQPYLLSLFLFTFFHIPVLALKQSYIVYMGGHAHGPDVTEADYLRVTDHHVQLLASYLGSSDMAKDSMIYSYTKHINGFAAFLEEEEAEAISKHPNVVSVFLNKPSKLHTTRSWNFLGLEKDGSVPYHSLWKKARFGEDTIIATLDTGVWPEHPSFDDHLMGPVPSRWKGICQNHTKPAFPCNRKLIGARYYYKGLESIYKRINMTFDASDMSARDIDGHGSHTLSTAGGNFVSNASIYGIGEGTASGGSPKARVAVYKVCWPQVFFVGGCYGVDTLAAFDDAIQDGVDVISMSLGGDAHDYFSDPQAIGAFHAVSKGIVVVCSGGNKGPNAQTIQNVAPWIITVGASTMDRNFSVTAFLGNNKSLKGESLSDNQLPVKFYPLISGADAKASNASSIDALRCMPDSLDPKKVKGKILACLGSNIKAADIDTDNLEKGMQASLAGAVGMILCNDVSIGNQLVPQIHYLPTINVNYKDGLSVFTYINSTKFPTAYIAPVQTHLNVKPAPYMAHFSSRGPNTITPGILKPDVTAPGVEVIAAYSQALGPTETYDDNRRVLFITMDGTSMSCPHVSGVVGLLKTLHPEWSPSAIKSAIMTTARIKDNKREAILVDSFERDTPFGYGAGHINPNHAADPGLVYDLNTKHYLNFLCAIGYNTSSIATISDQPYKCPKTTSLLDFNYPSITVPSLYDSVTVTRTLKNVGTPGTYHARIRHPVGINVTVSPSILTFKKKGEEQTFKMTLTPRSPHAARDYVFGKLTWFDPEHRHSVRSPITVKAKLKKEIQAL